MEILEDHQEVLSACQAGELPQERLEGLILLLLRREVEWRVTIVEGQRKKFGQ
jgi:hypothetical protein